MIERLATPYLRRINKRLLSFAQGSPHPVLPVPKPGRRYLLYVHVPFCELLCPFCSFHRVRFVPDLADRYFSALRAEIRHYAARGFEVADVYVGGGTPTVDITQLTRTLTVIRDHFDVTRISVETNPDHLREPVLGQLKDAGVNRLSVGIQSFDNRLLSEMQRLEKYGDGDVLANRLADAANRFDTLNADMIFNFPHQDTRSLGRDIERLLDIGVDQISYYPLMTATTVRERMTRHLGAPTPGREKAFYYQILDGLTPAYQQSSVWCFSNKPGLVDEYIIDHDEYLGVGSGAFSYLDGTLYATSFSILDYDRLIDAQAIGLTHARHLDRRDQLRFALLTSLFALALDRETFCQRLGADALDTLAGELRMLRWLGSINEDNQRISLTRQGLYHWVVMMREFLNGVNNLRDEMRAHSRAELEASYGDEPATPISIR